MTDTTSLTQWREWLADHAQSGLTVARWCAAHDIPPQRFYYWRRKLAGASVPVERDAVDWLALPVAVASTSQSALTVRVGNAAIDVAPGFDSGLLRAIVAALSSQRC